MLHAINGEKKNIAAVQSFQILFQELSSKYEGTIYYGFALSEIDNSRIIVDVLIVTKEKGILALNFSSGDAQQDINNVDRIYVLMRSLLEKNSRLRERRELAIPINIINYVINSNDIPHGYEEEYVTQKQFMSFFENKLTPFNSKYFEALNESLDKVVSAKPKKSRNNIQNMSSLGAKIKEIELELANMDRWQRQAAYELPRKPQRIRGLAGSGKTVVLALKAAYLHFTEPEADIVVTFYTRTLYQQFRSLIQEFYQQYSSNNKVDFDKVHILHAWGTLSEPGVYSSVANEIKANIYTYKQATSEFGKDFAFKGACEYVLSHMEMNRVKNVPMYDYILIDEAQDMPPTFFKLMYKLFKTSDKNLVYAYDELQNLSKSSMPSLKEMFGTDEQGNALVEIKNSEDPTQPKTDIILPVCYRNSKWVLTIAHSLGFGVYRNKKEPLVQFFKDLEVWNEIGYEIVEGELEFNHFVKLKRKREASPQYFERLLTPAEAVWVTDSFENKDEEYKWVSQQIKKNIEEDELDADDILVIFPDTTNSYSNYEKLEKFLRMAGIDSIMPGKNVDRDTFTLKNHITCTHIYRAKGNERPMVYLLDGEYGARNRDLINVRNTLFTAITRSRAWVRISGVGIGMEEIKQEIHRCIAKEYCLEINIPKEHEIEKLNLLNRDINKENEKTISNAERSASDLIGLIRSGRISIYDIPQLKDLAHLLESKNEE
ncbi:DEAD/DEAH box helicase [Paenibacillus campi]|uniref:DEAD/DEAH box helicase n=1 Tax=Paenibacillus campi TaxID=3106031 RepID=UPI002AFE8AEE|nr:ATP-binding domain-containing protein [Paenibacillus sp. SGZ-1014]